MKYINISEIPGMVVPETYITDILTRKLRERGISVTESQADAMDLQLGVADFGVKDGFRIEKLSETSAKVVGNDQRGLLYGVGKFLRECSFGDGEFTPCEWTGFSSPAKPVRGMYFATHFHNYYHDAPTQAINEYVEDLALWGCSSISVWYDMHHYTGINDPAAQEMIAKLKVILKAAKRIGLQPGLTSLANEGYSTTPDHLKSIPTQTAHYGVEICPSKQEGLDLIVKLRQEMLEAFKEVEAEYVWIWPYDQGGCTCSDCMPWGYNGFLKSGKAEAEVVKQIFPTAKTVVSTWCFDYFIEGEYAGFQKSLETGELDWADYLMIDAHGEFPPYVIDHGVPGGLPALGFPEISMYYMTPWGGWGANPLPNHIQTMWDTSGHLLSGGFPYSEGIFEDLNKAICFQLYWDPQKKVSETVKEYARYELGVDPDIMEQACNLMEADQHHWKGEESSLEYHLEHADHAFECLELTQKAAKNIPDWAAKSWRWRILYIRAAIDAALTESKGLSTPAIDAMLEELSDIYYADGAEYTVCPLSIRHLKRLYGEITDKQ